ncbi:MAG: hypothetical protein CML73_02375 [Rhodobiaceae bacterium]|nr:hypothetical protein [Rhodobiaceae bacterium]
MSPARVGDKITYTLFKETCRSVLEDGKVSFFYEIAERIFVLSNHLRDTRDIGINNLEVVGDFAHVALKLRTKKPKAGVNRQVPCSLCQDEIFGFSKSIE